MHTHTHTHPVRANFLSAVEPRDSLRSLVNKIDAVTSFSEFALTSTGVHVCFVCRSPSSGAERAPAELRGRDQRSARPGLRQGGPP